jgi:hypothetical protein
MPYSGYIHLIPRLIACAGAALDPALIPIFYLYSSLALTLLVVARVFSPRLDLPAKPLVALAIVGVPHTGEVFLCITNVQWITSLALVLTLLMRDPVGPRAWACDIAILLIAGLSGPFGLFLLPFYALRALERATAASCVLLAVVAAVALLQGLQIYHNSAVAVPENQLGPFRFLNFVAVLSSRVPLALLGAQGWAYRAGRAFVVVAGVAGIAAAAAMALARGRYRRERICLLLFGALLVCLSAVKVRTDTWDYRDLVQGDRYFYLPKVLLLWITVLWFGRSSPESVPPALAIAAAGLFCASMIPYVAPQDLRTRHVERPFFPWEPYVEPLRKGESVEVEVSPGWKFQVPARDSR